MSFWRIFGKRDKKARDVSEVSDIADEEISLEEFYRRTNLSKLSSAQLQAADSRQNAILEKSKFTATVQSLHSRVALDESRRLIRLDNAVFGADEIVEIEVVEDGYSIAKTSNLSLLGRAAVGGLLFGGVGAVVGGLSAKKTTTSTVDRVDLRVLVNTSSQPLRVYNFLIRSSAKGANEHLRALGDAKRIQAIVSGWIARRADET